MDHFTFLGNCPPTPTLSQHFALSEKEVNVGLLEGDMYVGSFPEMFNDPILFS